MTKECECEEIEIRTKGSSFGSRLKGLLLGGLIGAGIALLAAPRSGMETRNMLRDKGNELKEKAKSQVDDTRSRAMDISKRGKSVLNDQKIELQSAVEGVKQGLKTYQEENTPEISVSNTSIPDTGTDWDTTITDSGSSMNP